MATSIELLRSDGSRRVCTPTENSDWFAANVGADRRAPRASAG